jgi:hypothetical protein
MEMATKQSLQNFHFLNAKPLMDQSRRISEEVTIDVAQVRKEQNK